MKVVPLFAAVLLLVALFYVQQAVGFKGKVFLSPASTLNRVRFDNAGGKTATVSNKAKCFPVASYYCTKSRPAWNTLFDITIKNCTDTSCAVVASTKVLQGYKLIDGFTCSVMPTVAAKTPADSAILKTWKNTVFTWNQANNDAASCNCGSWTVQIADSLGNLANKALRTSFSVPCPEITDPPPVNFPMSFTASGTLAANTPTIPWYYWNALMKSDKNSLAVATDPRKFCVPKLPNAVTLLTPMPGATVVGDTTFGVNFTATWSPTTSWGFGCTTDKHVYTLAWNANNGQITGSSAGITGTTMTVTITGFTTSVTMQWWVLAGQTYQSKSAVNTVTICMAGTPATPSALLPARGTQVYASTVTLSWTYTDANWGAPCGIPISSFRFDILAGVTANFSLVGTVASSARQFVLNKSLFQIGKTGTTVYWRVRAVGALGHVSQLGPSNVMFCNSVAPSPPKNLLTVGSSMIICRVPSQATFTASWSAPASWGSHCQPPAFVNQYNVTATGAAAVLTSSTSQLITVPCGTKTVVVAVASFNGGTSSAAVSTSISICGTVAPKAPAITAPTAGRTFIISGATRSVALQWGQMAASDWGESCSTVATRGFIVRYGIAGSIPTQVLLSNITATSYVVSVSSAGTWAWSVASFNGDMQSAATESNWILCRQTSPSIPELLLPAPGASVANDTISFSWQIGQWGESCGRATRNTFTFRAVNAAGITVTKSNITERQTVITFPDEATSWTWSVSASNGLAGIPESTSSTRKLFQKLKCELAVPVWPANALVSPPPGAISRDNGVVAFSWAPVSSFGTICTTSRAWYRLVVDGVSRNVSSTSTSATIVLGSGTHTWEVVAHNGNVSTSGGSSSFDLCSIGKPPTISAACPTKPLILPASITWNPPIWGPTCGFAGTIVVELKAGSQTSLFSGLSPTATSFDLPAPLQDGPYFVVIDSLIGGMRATGVPCSLSVCTPQAPPEAVLSAPSMFYSSSVTLDWSSDAAQMANTACNSSSDFLFNVTLRNATDGSVVKSETIHEPARGMYAELSPGNYEWSVDTWNGFYWSGMAGWMKFSVCIPMPIPDLAVVSPMNAAKPLANDIRLKWSPFPSIQSCGSPVQYTVLFGKSAETMSVLSTVDSSATEFAVASGVTPGTAYFWTIAVNTTHFQKTGPISRFTACVPSDPVGLAPQWPLTSDEQPAVIAPRALLKWTLGSAGETCDLGNEVAFTVSLIRTDQGASTEIVYDTTAESSYLVYDLDVGQYSWRVSATNKGGASITGDPNNFTVCHAVGPSQPELLGPASGAVVRRREFRSFEISAPFSLGVLCRSTNSSSLGHKLYRGTSSETLFLSPLKLGIDVPTATTADGFESVEFTNVSLSYGEHFWTASLTNGDGLESVSEDVFSIFVCDSPIAVNPVSPGNNSAGAATNGLSLSWSDLTAESWGYACVALPGIPQIRLYLDAANGTVLFQQIGSASTATIGGLQVNTSYAWRVGIYNGFEEALSDVMFFSTVERDCTVVDCIHGTCDPLTLTCICDAKWKGGNCGTNAGMSSGAIAAIVVCGVSFVAACASAFIVFAVVAMRKRRRERLRLRAPGGDLRFGTVKASPAGISHDEEYTVEGRIEGDVTGGYERAVALATATQSTEIDNVCKALLYGFERSGHGLDLLKALITAEVAATKSTTTIFRANTPATTMFKHYSKMVGLSYLFDTLSELLCGLLQKEMDAKATQKDISDKGLVGLSVLDDVTCEVDPLKLDAGACEDGLIGVNSLQLTITSQKFLAQIFRSVNSMPNGLREVCRHLKAEVEKRFPEAVVQSLGAFIFLRFLNCAIAIPESYGLIPRTPSEGVRRTLLLVTKILTTLSSGAHFGDKESFMQQYNELIDGNHEALERYYATLCTVDDRSPATHTEVPDKQYRDSLTVLASKGWSV